MRLADELNVLNAAISSALETTRHMVDQSYASAKTYYKTSQSGLLVTSAAGLEDVSVSAPCRVSHIGEKSWARQGVNPQDTG